MKTLSTGINGFGRFGLHLLKYWLDRSNESNFSIENTKIVINYGFNKIRFIQPVRSGEKIRAKFSLLNFSKRKKDEILVTYGVNVELENDQKPVLFAEWLILLLLNY